MHITLTANVFSVAVPQSCACLDFWTWCWWTIRWIFSSSWSISTWWMGAVDWWGKFQHESDDDMDQKAQQLLRFIVISKYRHNSTLIVSPHETWVKLPFGSQKYTFNSLWHIQLLLQVVTIASFLIMARKHDSPFWVHTSSIIFVNFQSISKWTCDMVVVLVKSCCCGK